MTPLPSSHAKCLEIWEPQPPGTLSVCPGLYRDSFTFYIFDHKKPKGVDAYVNKQHARKEHKESHATDGGGPHHYSCSNFS